MESGHVYYTLIISIKLEQIESTYHLVITCICTDNRYILLPCIMEIPRTSPQ